MTPLPPPNMLPFTHPDCWIYDLSLIESNGPFWANAMSITIVGINGVLLTPTLFAMALHDRRNIPTSPYDQQYAVLQDLPPLLLSPPPISRYDLPGVASDIKLMYVSPSPVARQPPTPLLTPLNDPTTPKRGSPVYVVNNKRQVIPGELVAIYPGRFSFVTDPKHRPTNGDSGMPVYDEHFRLLGHQTYGSQGPLYYTYLRELLQKVTTR